MYIKLEEGLFIQIDQEDLHILERCKTWSCTKGGYVRGHLKNSVTYTPQVLLHRLILPPREGLTVDHINRDILDCRRSNLRLATPSQNGANRPKQTNNKTGFKGVFLRPSRRHYTASIRIDNVSKHIGQYKTALEAALAYDKEAFLKFGIFAGLNFPLRVA